MRNAVVVALFVAGLLPAPRGSADEVAADQGDDAETEPEAPGVRVLLTEASAATWTSSEGLALRLAPGLMLAHGAQSLSLVHGMDVYARDVPYHHWELTYGSGPNAAYLGTRYQNQDHAGELEAGVVLGAPFLNFGVGLVADTRERRLKAVTLRGTIPVLSLPFLVWEKFR